MRTVFEVLLEKLAASNRHERLRAKQRGIPQERRRMLLARLRAANNKRRRGEADDRLQRLAPFAVHHGDGSTSIVDHGRSGKLFVRTHLSRNMRPRAGTRHMAWSDLMAKRDR